jgi:pyruvate/2-oxoglutarate dehydrogenase complex dihydrolipoamide dehydrogenase (E3) component
VVLHFTGTIPSKSLRETVMHLALLRQQTHGIEINFKENLTIQELMYRKEIVENDCNLNIPLYVE